MVQGLGVKGLGVRGLGFRVQGLGVRGLGFMAERQKSRIVRIAGFVLGVLRIWV